MPVSPHPLIPALHTRKRDSSPQNLDDWATSILAFHQSPEAVLEWQISSVKWFKNKSGLEHEYPVFTLKNKSSPNTEIYLRFDRRSSAEALDPKKQEIVVSQDVYSDFTPSERKKVTAAVKQERQSLLRKHAKGIIHMSKMSSRKDDGYIPEDTIVRSRQSNGVDNRDSDQVELLVTYSNFSHPFPLRDLAIIAKTVVSLADAYLLLVQQCYWFTRTIVGISVTNYYPQPAEGINNITHNRSGRINRLPFVPIINSENSAEISNLVALVISAINEDNLHVQERYMKGEGGKKEAEAARAAAEKRMAAAEERAVNAEKRACEQEKRARELEEKLAANLRRSPSGA